MPGHVAVADLTIADEDGINKFLVGTCDDVLAPCTYTDTALTCGTTAADYESAQRPSDHCRPAPWMQPYGLSCLLRPGQAGTSQDRPGHRVHGTGVPRMFPEADRALARSGG
jgi:hypothetical protein